MFKRTNENSIIDILDFNELAELVSLDGKDYKLISCELVRTEGSLNKYGPLYLVEFLILNKK